MKKEEFALDFEKKTYVYRANGTEVEIEGDAFCDITVALAEEILAAYPGKINAIVEHLIAESQVDIFFDVPKTEIANKLHSPSFRIIKNDWCVLTYTEHELDEAHIISVEFRGVLEDLSYVTIDG